MDIKAARRANNFVGKTCTYWLAGRCNRNPCRFLHEQTPSVSIVPHNGNTANKYSGKRPLSSAEHTPKHKSKLVWVRENDNTGTKTSLAKAPQKPSHSTCDRQIESVQNKTSHPKVPQKSSKSIFVREKDQKSSCSICKYWINSNCVHGEQCPNLHSWFSGDGLSTIAKLQGHKKVVTGIALPAGSDKLYSASTDGTVQIWDCHTGQCTNMINLGSEVTSLIAEAPWIFVGVQNAVKAWNIQTVSEFTLDGPKGQVLAMVVGNDTLFAAAEDGVISAWRGSSDAKSPFQMVASLSGHTKAVICLTVGKTLLYSGSKDHSIKVWDLNTLKCIMTLNGHTDVVTSLICWDEYLLSSSYDCTIKVWAATGQETFEATHTHTEEKGVVALNGMTDAEDKHILFCSLKDNSVCLYEMPSFSERGQIFSKQEVQSIEMGPGGLFFTGDRSGSLMVWKWLKGESKMASSS